MLKVKVSLGTADLPWHESAVIQFLQQCLAKLEAVVERTDGLSDSKLHLGRMDRQKFKRVRGLRVLIRVSIKRLNITFR